MLNKKSFLYQAGILALSNTALMLLAFAYRIVIGRLAGPEGLGVYTLVMQVYTILMSIAVYGLCTAVTQLSASLMAEGGGGGVRVVVRAAMTLFFLLFALLALPVFFLRGHIAADILGDARAANALGMVLVCVLLTGFENILKAMLYGLRLVKYTAISEVGEQTLRIVLAALLLYTFMNGDHGRTALIILFVMTLSEVYSVVVLGITYARHAPRASSRGEKKARQIRRRLFALAIPSAWTSILGNVFASASVILFPMRLVKAGLTRVAAVSMLGVVSGMLMPILLLPSALISALCTLLMPSVAGCASRGNLDELRRKAEKGIEAVGLLGIPSMTLLLPFVPMLCAMVFGETVAFPLIVLMTLETVVTFYLILVNSILNGMGRQKQVLMLTAAREIAQIALIWFLAAMPGLNVYGYALGLLAGDFVHMAGGFFLVRRYTGARPRLFHALITPAASAVVLYIAARLLFFQAVAWGCTMLGAALLGMACGVLLYAVLLRLLGVRAWTYLKRAALIRG